MVWEDYPQKKDYTWEPIENLYGHEDLPQTDEQWLKAENERLDSEEIERKTVRFSFAGLTLSDLCKSLLEGTLEAIMWAKWGSPGIPLGRGDLHITYPELCD